MESAQMWSMFKTKQRQAPPEWPQVIAELKDRLVVLEKDVRDVRMDWNTTYEKFHALTMRMAKRVKREEEKEPEDRPQATNSAPSISNPLAEKLLQRGRIS